MGTPKDSGGERSGHLLSKRADKQLKPLLLESIRGTVNQYHKNSEELARRFSLKHKDL